MQLVLRARNAAVAAEVCLLGVKLAIKKFSAKKSKRFKLFFFPFLPYLVMWTRFSSFLVPGKTDSRYVNPR